MHELGVASSILETCQGAVLDQPPGRIVRVRLRLGELATVEPELLAFAWQAVTADGPHAGSQLDVEWCLAEQHCPSCGEAKPRREGGWLRECPDCGGVLRLRGGTQIEVVELSYETEDLRAEGR
mgnify:CR=1 FL=1